MESSTLLTARSWKLIHIDKVILLASVVGLVMTVNENDSSISSMSSNSNKIWHLEIEGSSSDFARMIRMMLIAVMFVKSLTRDVYIACYLVMIYGYSSGRKNNVLPWIITSGVRSLFSEAVACFAGCLACSNYSGIRYACLDFIITKGFMLACSACLWTMVFESYQSNFIHEGGSRLVGMNSTSARSRSLESILAEAVVDWFLEEAERCRKFDSILAVEEDIVRFEEGLSQRAAQFLQATPEAIAADVKSKMERERDIIRRQRGTQTETLTTEELTKFDEHEVKSTTSDGGHTISEFDMEIRNPLRKFPYFPIVQDVESFKSPSDEFNGDVVLGNKSVSVQTMEIDDSEETVETKSQMMNSS